MRVQWFGIGLFILGGHTLAAEPEAWAAVVRRAQALERDGNLPQAADLLRRWLSSAESSGPAERAVTWNNLGSVRQQMGDYADAERCYWRAIGTLRDSGRTFVTAINNLASMHLELGEPGRLKKLGLERILERLESDARHGPDFARLLENIGEMYFLRGKLDRAEPLYQHAVQLWQSLSSAASPQEAAAWNRLGLCHYEMGRYSDAETEFRKAASIYSALGAAHRARLAVVQVNVASVYVRTGRSAEASQAFHIALETAESGYGPASRETWQVLANYAATLRKAKRNREAKPLQDRADTISRSGQRPKLGFSVDVAEFQTLSK